MVTKDGEPSQFTFIQLFIATGRQAMGEYNYKGRGDNIHTFKEMRLRVRPDTEAFYKARIGVSLKSSPGERAGNRSRIDPKTRHQGPGSI